MQFVASQPCTGAMASWSFPLEKTVWSFTPATAAWLSLVKAALTLSGAIAAVWASSALACSSSAVLPCAAESGRRVAPVACSEILAQAAAAVGNSPYGPADVLGLGLADEGAGLASADDGALAASGAEQAVSASEAKRAATVNGRAMFVRITLWESLFRLRLDRRPVQAAGGLKRSFPSVRV